MKKLNVTITTKGIMKAEHTKGPWIVYHGSPSELVTIIDSQNCDIAELFPFIDDYSEDEMNANAKLMAAAPDMLEELQDQRQRLKEILDDEIMPVTDSALRIQLHKQVARLTVAIRKATE